MTTREPHDAFGEAALERAIRTRAAASGIELPPAAATGLARHARAVRERNPELHLTSIVEPAEFVERHLGEAFEGAALLDPAIRGTLVDLGSGNGYPGIPLAAARPGLRAVLVEAAARKAEFLRVVLALPGLPPGSVLERHVQRSADLDVPEPVRVLVARAVGSWERILPRLVPRIAADGRVLLWAGADVETVAARAAWNRLRVERRRPLPGRDRSWVWELRPAAGTR